MTPASHPGPNLNSSPTTGGDFSRRLLEKKERLEEESAAERVMFRQELYKLQQKYDVLARDRAHLLSGTTSYPNTHSPPHTHNILSRGRRKYHFVAVDVFT